MGFRDGVLAADTNDASAPPDHDTHVDVDTRSARRCGGADGMESGGWVSNVEFATLTWTPPQ